MATKLTIIMGPRIEVKGSLRRHEIVKKVVNHFIKTEYSKKAAGIKFQYPVEDLLGGIQLMIGRPGLKKNFDFKVIIEPTFGLSIGQHEEISEDVRNKSQISSQHCEQLWDAINEIYHCSENDVDIVLATHHHLKQPFDKGAQVEVLLKVLKWLFVMEDIVYWDNEGRAYLYNYLNYVAKETDIERLEEAKKEMKIRPINLKRYMKKLGLEWIPSRG